MTVTRFLPRHWPSSLRAYIGGRFANGSSSKETWPITFSATNDTFYEFKESGSEEVDFAVEAAFKAQEIWKQFSPVEKARVLKNISDELTKRNDEIAYIESIDTSR